MPKTEYKYKRIKTPVSDQRTLKEKGYTPFFSSNVSAGQRDKDNLYIRFHNGSIYKYPNQGKNFNSLLTSSSKGKWVWANLRRKNVAFSKVGSLPLAGDIDLTDEQLFKELKVRKIQPLIISHLLSTLIDIENVNIFSTIVAKDTLLNNGIIAGGLANIIKGM